MSNHSMEYCIRKRWRRDCAGVAAVEFALVAPVFAVLLLGIISLGFSIRDHHEAREGVRAGVHAVMSDVNDLSAIKSIVYASLSKSQSRSLVTVSRDKRCQGSSTTYSTCSDGTEPQEYIDVGVKVFTNSELTGSPKFRESMEVRVD